MLGFVGIWGFRLQYVFYNHLWSRFVSFFALFVVCRKRNWFVKVHWVWFVNFICIGSRFVSFLLFTNLYAVGSRFVSFFDLFVVCREPNWFVLFICIGFGLYALGPMWFVLFTPYICSRVPMHYFFAIDFGALLGPYLICLCIG
jgi:hypothetical protein